MPAHTLINLPGNALGDLRWWGYEIPNEADRPHIEEHLAELAGQQIDVRQSIPLGGKQALYLAHLHELAVEMGVFLVLYRPPAPKWQTHLGRFHPATMKIEAPLPITRMHYLTALHEFGHAAQPQLDGTTEQRDVTAEGIYGEMMAYMWAFDQSRTPVTPSDRENAQNKVFYDCLRAGCRSSVHEWMYEWMPEDLRERALDMWTELQ